MRAMLRLPSRASRRKAACPYAEIRAEHGMAGQIDAVPERENGEEVGYVEGFGVAFDSGRFWGWALRVEGAAER